MKNSIVIIRQASMIQQKDQQIPEIALAMELLSRPSITPMDEGCQGIISSRLAQVGFQSEQLHCNEVSNTWTYHGSGSPLFVFAGHTDVVPPGDLSSWASPPFSPEIRDGYMYGRGASDMKGAIAAFVIAAEQFVREHPKHAGTIALLLTSDEEGSAEFGTKYVVEQLLARDTKIDYCIVGEPSSSSSVGDAIKIGRRGSLSATLKVMGKQGHVAYPEKVENPIHRAIPALEKLLNTTWDTGNDFFPPTSLQISYFHADGEASNIVPQISEILFNFRYSPAITAASLQKKVKDLLDEALSPFPLTSYTLDWRLGSDPFLKKPAKLVSSISSVIQNLIGYPPSLSTAGGTSDGRFLAPIAKELIELGLVNDTIHQVNENVRVSDLNLLTRTYYHILVHLLAVP